MRDSLRIALSSTFSRRNMMALMSINGLRIRWSGFLLMNIGECGNFISYAFAPASIVAPLGTVRLTFRVLVTVYYLSGLLTSWHEIYLSVCSYSQLSLRTPHPKRTVSKSDVLTFTSYYYSLASSYILSHSVTSSVLPSPSSAL